MKAFIFDLANKLQRTSNSLDTKATLCNKTWRVFTDTGEKEVYIFMEDGTLVKSLNGIVEMATWKYIPANQSLVLTGKQNFLVHPVICRNILVLIVDGTNNCAFLLDDTKKEIESINSLLGISSYINQNANNKTDYNVTFHPLSSSSYTDSKNINIETIPFLFGQSGKYVDRELWLDIRQIRRKQGFAQNGIYYSPYNDFSLLPDYGSIWAYSPDYKGNFDSCKFIFIFQKDGTLTHIHYHSIMPNGKWRSWLRVDWSEKFFYLSRNSKYKRYNTYNIPGSGDCINDIIDEYTWMNRFGEILKADVKQYCDIFQDVFGVNPILNPFWEWK